MFQRILVPVDGSHLSEQAIPFAARIARASHGTILLVYVVVPRGIHSPRPFSLLQESLDLAHSEAKAYLTRLAASPDLSGIETQMKICYEHPANAILKTAQNEQIDLIVMCSRGQTGLTRWALGSVAQKVIHLSTVPVMVLQPETRQADRQKAESTHGRILVGLDGSPLAEAAIEPARELAKALTTSGQGEVVLIQCVQEPTIEERQVIERAHLDLDLTEFALHEAERYLRTIIRNLANEEGRSRVTTKWSVEVCRDVADSLIQKAEGNCDGEEGPYDCLALTTHGRGGLQHWYLGSIAERVLQNTKVPLLVAHL